MRFSEIETMPAGQILKVVNDGGFMAGQGAQFKRVTYSGYMAEVIIKGAVHWISIERLEK